MNREERERMTRNLAEAIDALYRQSAAPRDHDRLIALTHKQIERAMYLAYRYTQKIERPEE